MPADLRRRPSAPLRRTLRRVHRRIGQPLHEPRVRLAIRRAHTIHPFHMTFHSRTISSARRERSELPCPTSERSEPPCPTRERSEPPCPTASKASRPARQRAKR